MKDLKNLTTNQREFLADWISYFQLNWMPEMQMQVDSDLNEGKINELQAKERRDLIQYFYLLSEEVYGNQDLTEFNCYNLRTEEYEDPSKILVSSIIESIEEKEKGFLSDFGFAEYTSLDEVPEEELEDLEINAQKQSHDLAELMSVAVSVRNLINAKNASNDKKELHRLKKELEISIQDLRSLRRKKNEEANWANSIRWSLDDLIHICKDVAMP